MSMSLDDAIFWIAITVFGSGLYLMPEYRVWGVALMVIGAAGILYSIRAHVRGPARSGCIVVLLMLLTWTAVAYDIYDRRMNPAEVGTKIVPTELRLQFNATDTMPVAVGQENIWRWYALEQITEILDPKTKKITGGPRTWTIFVAFDNPIPIKEVRIYAGGGRIPRYEVKDFSNRTAVIVFSGDLTGVVIDIAGLS